MINDTQKYLINGWAINMIIELIKSLRLQVEKSYKNYKKDEFITIINSYNSIIKYLLTLEKGCDILEKEYTDDMQTKLNNFLKNMNIPTQNKKNNDNSENNNAKTEES